MNIGKSQVDVELFSTAADVNEIYQEAIESLKQKKMKKVPAKRNGRPTISAAEKEQAAKDYYANVRTNVCPESICVWCFPFLISEYQSGSAPLGGFQRELT